MAETKTNRVDAMLDALPKAYECFDEHENRDAIVDFARKLATENDALREALQALLHAQIIYDGGGDDKTIDNASHPETERLAVIARAALRNSDGGKGEA